MRHVLATSVLLAIVPAAAAQVALDHRVAVDLVAQGLGDQAGGIPTAIVFVTDDVALVARRGNGTIVRVDLHPGAVATAGPLVRDLHVINPGTDDQSEYGVQGMALHPGFDGNGFVYLRYDRSPQPYDVPESAVVISTPGASIPTDNVIERCFWDPDAPWGSGLDPDADVFVATVDTRYHHGGPLLFDATGSVCCIYGDLRRTSSTGWQAQTGGPLRSVNIPNGVVEPHGSVVRITDDGGVPFGNPFPAGAPGVPPGTEIWWAYGIRNSYGLAMDPVSTWLWDTENGPLDFDEVNRVTPGLNGGWQNVMGPGAARNLVELPGSHYAEPAFSWHDTIGVTGLHFLAGSALGPEFDRVVLVGCYNDGHLWGLPLNAERTAFEFQTPALQDNVDDRVNALEVPPGPDGQEIVLATGVGGPNMGIVSIVRGPANYPCMLTGDGRLFRLRRAADLDADGSVGTSDFLMLLGLWGPCSCTGACPGDLDGDCTVGVVDVLLLLGQWG